MGGHVLFSDVLEGVVIAPVCGVAGESSAAPVGREELFASHSIIDGEEMAAEEFRGDGGEECSLVASDFRTESIGAGWPVGLEEFLGLEEEGFPVMSYAEILPESAPSLDEIDWKGIEKLIGKMDTGEFRKKIGRLHPAHTAALQALLLGIAQRFEWFDEDHGCAIQWSSGERVEHILCEAAIVRALFDKREISGASQDFPEFDKLTREDFSKHGAETHARVKIPPVSHDCPTGGVVAASRIIEGELHKPGKRDGAGDEDFCGDAGAKAG
jgi:hypothetical protein